MLVRITYDVTTQDPEGNKRLRRVARICTNYGERVQKSVFECKITPAQKVTLENELRNSINLKKDSIRIYNLGNNSSSHITHIGTHIPIDVDEPLIF